MNASRWAVSAALCASLGFAGTASAADEGWYIVGFAGEASAQNVNQGELDQNVFRRLRLGRPDDRRRHVDAR